MAPSLVLPKFDRAVCSGCGDCVDVCHARALAIQDRIAVLVSPGDCDYCTDCEAVCPVGAITCPFEVVAAG
jgi:ferredoxin